MTNCRRLCQGLASVPGYIEGLGWPEFRNYGCLSTFPWWTAAQADDGSLPEAGSIPLCHSLILLHLECTPRRNSRHSYDGHVGDEQWFHIVFYELLEPLELPSDSDRRHTTRFYDKKSTYLRKSCFTVCDSENLGDRKRI
jgi:hypothetical protein